MRTDLTKGEKHMADLTDPSKPSRKHKVIHWNPEDDEGQAHRGSALKASLIGAFIAVGLVGIAAGGYFFFIYEKPTTTVIANSDSGISNDPRAAFESVSYAQGVKDSTYRKLETARVMPTGGHDSLKQQLIAVEKEIINADKLMDSKSFARAITHFNYVDSLIEDFVQVVENKKTAQNLYDSFLTRTTDLERSKHLNEADYKQSFVDASIGNQFLQTGSFTPALRALEKATQSLDAVDTTIAEFIQANGGLGHRYIAQGKSDEAIAAFNSILEVDPENEDAINQLKRARNANTVFGHLQTAANQEKEEELEAAQASFEQAFEIDSASAKAQSGISRTKRKIEQRDYGYHYDQALAAYSDKNYQEAIKHYRAALAIFPQRSELEDAIEKSITEEHQDGIVSRITRAYDFEREFAWPEARDLYQELVNLEPDLQEAKDGLLRSGRMIRNILRYETLIDAAKVEAKRADFQMAVRTFDRAMQSKPDYLDLTDEGERLRTFLQLQSQPVSVDFFSDGSTWVSVQGPSHRKPEKIDETTLSLLPGKYFVIGRRKGYQDVRFSLQIRGGVAQAPLTVVCETKNNY